VHSNPCEEIDTAISSQGLSFGLCCFTGLPVRRQRIPDLKELDLRETFNHFNDAAPLRFNELEIMIKFTMAEWNSLEDRKPVHALVMPNSRDLSQVILSGYQHRTHLPISEGSR